MVSEVSNRSGICRGDCVDLVVVSRQHLTIDLQLLNNMLVAPEGSESHSVHARLEDHVLVSLMRCIGLQGSFGNTLALHIVNGDAVILVIALMVDMPDHLKRVHLSRKAAELHDLRSHVLELQGTKLPLVSFELL